MACQARCTRCYPCFTPLERKNGTICRQPGAPVRGPRLSALSFCLGLRLVQLPLGALALELHHAAVESAAGHQLGGGALLGHAAVVQHHDAVRPGHGAHPVGDDQHGFAGQQAGEGALDLGLVLHIQAGGGLVQQDDGGILQKGPGDGDALAFPAGELGSVLPDGGIIALGQPADEFPAVGGLRRGPHLLVGGPPATQPDVFHDGVVKEHHILEHHGVIPQQGLRVHGGDVHPAHLDGALGDVPQPSGQPGAGALAGAGGAHQGGDLPLLGGEAHTVQDFFLVVGKAHLAEHNVVPLGLEVRGALRHRRVVDFRHAVGGHLGDEQLRDEGQALVEGGIDPGDDQQEQEEQHEVNLAGENPVGAHQDGGGHAQTHDDAGGVDKDAGAQFALDGDLLVVVNLLVQPGQIPGLLVGGADLPDILQGLLDAVGDADGGLFRPLRAAGGEPAGAEQQAEGHGHPPQAGDGQLPVIHQQAHRDERRGEVGAVQIAQHMGPDVLHAVDISHEGLGEVGQVPLAEVAQGQLPQALGQAEAGGLDLVVDQAVGCLVLLQMGEEGQENKQNHQAEERRGAGQRPALC